MTRQANCKEFKDTRKGSVLEQNEAAEGKKSVESSVPTLREERWAREFREKLIFVDEVREGTCQEVIHVWVIDECQWRLKKERKKIHNSTHTRVLLNSGYLYVWVSFVLLCNSQLSRTMNNDSLLNQHFPLTKSSIKMTQTSTLTALQMFLGQ